MDSNILFTARIPSKVLKKGIHKPLGAPGPESVPRLRGDTLESGEVPGPNPDPPQGTTRRSKLAALWSFLTGFRTAMLNDHAEGETLAPEPEEEDMAVHSQANGDDENRDYKSRPKNTQSALLSLPEEILLQIMKHLELDSAVYELRGVSSTFSRIFHDPSLADANKWLRIEDKNPSQLSPAPFDWSWTEADALGMMKPDYLAQREDAHFVIFGKSHGCCSLCKASDAADSNPRRDHFLRTIFCYGCQVSHRAFYFDPDEATGSRPICIGRRGILRALCAHKEEADPANKNNPQHLPLRWSWTPQVEHLLQAPAPTGYLPFTWFEHACLHKDHQPHRPLSKPRLGTSIPVMSLYREKDDPDPSPWLSLTPIVTMEASWDIPILDIVVMSGEKKIMPTLAALRAAIVDAAMAALDDDGTTPYRLCHHLTRHNTRERRRRTMETFVEDSICPCFLSIPEDNNNSNDKEKRTIGVGSSWVDRETESNRCIPSCRCKPRRRAAMQCTECAACYEWSTLEGRVFLSYRHLSQFQNPTSPLWLALLRSCVLDRLLSHSSTKHFLWCDQEGCRRAERGDQEARWLWMVKRDLSIMSKLTDWVQTDYLMCDYLWGRVHPHYWDTFKCKHVRDRFYK